MGQAYFQERTRGNRMKKGENFWKTARWGTCEKTDKEKQNISWNKLYVKST
ncbi:hypothetical protein lbkm_2336 [Lachnospiraceae bacterium KM106-2]|nr:hypothetical protein lbkm_2336 [Lachnospiraceae bacterium KM106-2]